MNFIEIELTARLRALVALDGTDSVDAHALRDVLPLNNPAFFYAAEVIRTEEMTVRRAETSEFQAGIHEFKVVFFQEFGAADPNVPLRVEVITGSRAEAFSLMKSVSDLATFSKVEVRNLQDGVEARAFLERAGHGVLESSTGRIVASRLSLEDARTRFSQELVKGKWAGLQLVDMRCGKTLVLATAQ